MGSTKPLRQPCAGTKTLCLELQLITPSTQYSLWEWLTDTLRKPSQHPTTELTLCLAKSNSASKSFVLPLHSLTKETRPPVADSPNLERHSSRLAIPAPLYICFLLWLSGKCCCSLDIKLPKNSNPTSMFSIYPSTFYNPLLEHQRPILKLNQGPRSSSRRSVWVSWEFSPYLN